MSAAAPLALYQLPALGAPWPGQGGVFVGLRKAADGATHALIRAEAQPDGELPWRKAMAWAAELRADGHADFRLPDREEARILWANDREAFDRTWYWLSTEYDRSFAWYQGFHYGDQINDHKGGTCRARAVRSFILQSFDPSAAVAP